MMFELRKYLSKDIIQANYRYKFTTSIFLVFDEVFPVIPYKDTLNVVVGPRS